MAAEDKTNQQVLEILVKKKTPDELMKLLRSGAVKPDQVVTMKGTGQKFTLLYPCIERGWTEPAVYLIQQGAEIDRAPADVGHTPLTAACAMGNQGIVEALLAAGVDVNRKSPSSEGEGGQTALMIAAENGHLEIVRRLLKAGADAKLTTRRGQTAIYCAMLVQRIKDRAAIVRELVAAGCPWLGNELHMPVYRRDVEATKVLLECGCPPSVPIAYGEADGPKKGDTPLTTAVGMNEHDLLEDLGPEHRTVERRQEITRLLLDRGADPNLVNAKGATPLTLAVWQTEPALAKMLIDAGADVNQPDGRGRTPLDLALERESPEIEEMLRKAGAQEGGRTTGAGRAKKNVSGAKKGGTLAKKSSRGAKKSAGRAKKSSTRGKKR